MYRYILLVSKVLPSKGISYGKTKIGTNSVKGLRRQRLIGSAVAGFNHAKIITKASATDLHARQVDFNKGI